MCEEEKGLLGKIRKNEGIKPIAVMLTLLGAKVDRRMASSRPVKRLSHFVPNACSLDWP